MKQMLKSIVVGAAAALSLSSAMAADVTGAGATFPYGRDPRNRNIRIAPSLPPLAQVETAMEVVAACVLVASARKLRG